MSRISYGSHNILHVWDSVAWKIPILGRRGSRTWAVAADENCTWEPSKTGFQYLIKQPKMAGVILAETWEFSSKMAVNFKNLDTVTHRRITPARKDTLERALLREVFDFALSAAFCAAFIYVDAHACLCLHMVSDSLAGCSRDTCAMPSTLRTWRLPGNCLVVN